MGKKYLFLYGLLAFSLNAFATPVKVTMNATSPTMSMVDSEGNAVETGEPVNKIYEFDVAPGKYLLTAYAANKTTVNGSIVLNVLDNQGSIFDDDLDDDYKNGIDDINHFTVITCTAYVSNKHQDQTSWTIEDGDYTLEVKVNTREGEKIESVYGQSKDKGRYTFLALNGNSYQVAFIPSDFHIDEGYMTLYRGGTLTANVNVNGSIPVGGEFSVEIPEDADIQLGMKFTHFTDFTPVEPLGKEVTGNGVKYNYKLAHGQIYNYRTWKKDGLTHAGYFTMNTSDKSKCPVLRFSDADYNSHEPKSINHNVQSNNGYETGDIFLNINPEGHLKLKQGEEFLIHAMRTWELTDNSTNNYFIEPDFHYTVLDLNFQPSDNVIEISNCLENNTSSWSALRAKGPGTAIVLVTYDGINLNYYNNADKKDYLGGSYWGAIWPENTGVFVVTVDEPASSAVPNMTVNEQYNVDALRLAGKFVDAEHDVFYYLDNEDGFSFKFTPENVASISVASPVISELGAEYSGFSNEAVTKSDDGSYSVLLKFGRNIIRLTDASGNSAYQVITAKPCHREITNVTRANSSIFQPGDQIKILYSGLFHPANKIAGIYNMSAYVTYNGIPNGSSLILGSGQYTFGSAASAQAVTVEIPQDYDVSKNPVWIMDEGVIQVNGYGDPIGNHRNTSPLAGRSPNFTAVPHKTYFGAIPDIKINISPVRYFEISLSGLPSEAEVNLFFNGTELSSLESGKYIGTYGTYDLIAKSEGYKCYRHQYSIDDDSEGEIIFNVEMEKLGKAWDGKTISEPILKDDVFMISSPSELAWFAENVNSKGGTQNALLLNDIELGNFDWTPIGTSSKPFSGSFEGNGHTVTELYVNGNTNYKGLFGYIKDAVIQGVTVKGSVSGKQYVGGIVGYITGNSTIDRCANYSNVTGSGTYVGGITGYLSSANSVMTNCYNTGNISGTTNCGGVVGSNNANAEISNIFNIGLVDGKTVGACVGGTTAKNKLYNAFSTAEYHIVDNQTKVSSESMASGEIAYKLGDAFFQTLGIDKHPVFEASKVYYDEDKDEYYNRAVGFNIHFEEENADVEIKDGILIMHVMDEYNLSIVAEPVGSRLPEITWQSSDEEVAEVDNNGKIIAIGKGDATIVASAVINNKTVESTCEVKVIKISSIADALSSDSSVDKVDIYDIDGKVVRLNASVEDCSSLNPGLYLFKFDKQCKVVLIKN